MTAYQEQLQDPRWQQKRLRILERDKWTCTECPESTLTLHIHHKRYERGKLPWEYEDETLCTLCKECHKLEEALKDRNIDMYDHAKGSNMTCIRLWKWISGASFLAKYHPDDYQKLAEYGNQNIISKFSQKLWSHAARPMEDIYG